MWRGQRVSVVFPTYNERESIHDAIVEFQQSGYGDEIVVVNNNAAPGTNEEVRRTSARLVHEPQQGYGHAIRRGFKEATGDLIIVSEPDGTFRGNDVPKLLTYSDEFDVVYGSRTHRQFIWGGANMGLFLRWGNYVVAKMMEFLFNANHLSDVGCTMRLIRRSALALIEPDFKVGGSFFGPEMMLLSLIAGQTMVQIPVHYVKRVGTSSVTGDPVKAFRLGLRMIALILEYRLRAWLQPGAFKCYGAARGAARGTARGATQATRGTPRAVAAERSPS